MTADIVSSLSLSSIKVEVDDEEGTVGVEEEDDLDLCFVCCSRVQVSRARVNCKNKLLNNNLRAVFLLRNLMQVPRCQLEENLKKCGNPENWVRLCEQCTQLTSEAMELHQKIVKIRQLILEKTKSSSKREDWRRREVWTRTRSLVINHEKITPTTTSTIHANNSVQIEEPMDCLGSEGNISSNYDDDDVERGDNLDNDNDWGDSQDQDDDYQCSEEETKHVSKRIYKKYIKVDGKYKCHHCEELFIRRQNCHDHEMQKHSTTPDPFACDFCDKRWSTRKKLTDHRRQVHKVKVDGTPAKSVVDSENSMDCPGTDVDWEDKQGDDYQCSEEETKMDNGMTEKFKSTKGAKYRSKRIYKKWIKIDGKYKCHHCDELFINRQNCHQHEMQMHSTTPGQFVCDFCGKRWTTRKNLTDHRRQVHKVKVDGTPATLPDSTKYQGQDYVCHTCGKTFTHPNCLRSHMNYVHLKKFNFPCPVCQNKFRNSTDVKRHLVRNHKEDPITKQIIAEGFTDQVHKKRIRKTRCKKVKVKAE